MVYTLGHHEAKGTSMLLSTQQEAPGEDDVVNVHDADRLRRLASDLNVGEEVILQAVYEVGPVVSAIRSFCHDLGLDLSNT